MLLNANLAPAVSGTTHKKRKKIIPCPKEFMIETKQYFYEKLHHQFCVGGCGRQ